MIYLQGTYIFKIGGIILGLVREEVAKNILFYRKKRKLTRKALSEKLSVSASAIVNWETGKNSIDMDTLHELCKVLNVSVVDIFGKCANMLEHNFSAREKDTIYKMRELNEEGIKYIEKQLHYALQQEDFILKNHIFFEPHNTVYNVEEKEY